MCGLTGIISNQPYITIDSLLKYGRLRGDDAFGYFLRRNNKIKCQKGINISLEEDMLIRDSQKEERVKNHTTVVLANHRASPETEVSSTKESQIQPIHYDDAKIALVHNGAVSKFVYDELAKDFQAKTEIDSEAIIWAYLEFNRDLRKTMQYLSGGFAFLLYDYGIEKFYAVCTHNPLYMGHVRGYGSVFSSIEEGIYKAISSVKGFDINRMNISVWEDYYCRQIPENTIVEIDMPSCLVNEFTFEPRYKHPKWDPYNRVKDQTDDSKKTVLVSCSGGLDSSTTAYILKASGYDVRAVHFMYGHRGEDSEEIAVDNIMKILDIPVIKFDIRQNMKLLDSTSMLTDKNHRITTGTDEDLKTTIAWTCFRNGFFVTYMGALAESLIINEGIEEVYITGGFQNLTESGCIVDCKENVVMKYDNTSVLPSEIKLGDKLLSYNFDEKKIELTIVKRVFNTVHNKTYILKLKYEAGPVIGKKEQKVSGEHPFYVKGKGWIETQNLKVGDIVYSLKECKMVENEINDEEFLLEKIYNFIYRVGNGWVIEDIEIIEGEQQMINYHCEPNNNFFINKIICHNSYPDNSERFINAFSKFAKFASIVGTRIKPMYACANLLKTDQYYILNKTGILDKIGNWLISCDRPKVIGGKPHNCSKNGMPGCGSGLLSKWAADSIGIDDKRLYYEVDDVNYVAYEKQTTTKKINSVNMSTLLNRLQIHNENLEILKKNLSLV